MKDWCLTRNHAYIHYHTLLQSRWVAGQITASVLSIAVDTVTISFIMELSDLSSWLGRPPPVARHDPSGPPQEEKEEAELDAELNGIVDEIVEPTVAEDGGTTKLPEESPNENQSRDQDELEMDVEAEGPSSVENIHPSPSQEGHSHYFLSHVEIPHVTDKGEYGLLPGSEIVERILAAWIVPDDTLYKVRLRSQEIEIVSLPLTSITPASRNFV